MRRKIGLTVAVATAGFSGFGAPPDLAETINNTMYQLSVQAEAWCGGLSAAFVVAAGVGLGIYGLSLVVKMARAGLRR